MVFNFKEIPLVGEIWLFDGRCFVFELNDIVDFLCGCKFDFSISDVDHIDIFRGELI